MHCMSLVYFVNQPLHVSGIFVAHHQEVHYIYTHTHTHTTIGTYCAEKRVVQNYLSVLFTRMYRDAGPTKQKFNKIVITSPVHIIDNSSFEIILSFNAA